MCSCFTSCFYWKKWGSANSMSMLEWYRRRSRNTLLKNKCRSRKRKHAVRSLILFYWMWSLKKYPLRCCIWEETKKEILDQPWPRGWLHWHGQLPSSASSSRQKGESRLRWARSQIRQTVQGLHSIIFYCILLTAVTNLCSLLGGTSSWPQMPSFWSEGKR